MQIPKEIAYRIDPALWVREVLGVVPVRWQEKFLRCPVGASLLVLTARQVGKTTTAGWAIAHCMIYRPGSLSVIACPTLRQSKEAVRRVREALIKAGAAFKTENVYALELANGARVLALPGSDESIRGLTVDGWIVADEAARLQSDMIAALRPMRARTKARLAMLSTAWSRTDPFWSAWESGGESWKRIKVTVDEDPTLFSSQELEVERVNLGEQAYRREYLGIPAGTHLSPFDWELYDRITTPLAIPHYEFVRPTIIAHDVGHTRDRSTAVIGGRSLYGGELYCFSHFKELPQGLRGSARLEALASVYHEHPPALIVVDVSFDPTYAELLFERFGARVIGLQITNSGDGMEFEGWNFKCGVMRVYTVGRSYLFDLLYREMQNGKVWMPRTAESARAYQQLANLELVYRQSGLIYQCPPGQHDDLAISIAMQVFSCQHRHCPSWARALIPRGSLKKPRPFDWRGCV